MPPTFGLLLRKNFYVERAAWKWSIVEFLSIAAVLAVIVVNPVTRGKYYSSEKETVPHSDLTYNQPGLYDLSVFMRLMGIRKERMRMTLLYTPKNDFTTAVVNGTKIALNLRGIQDVEDNDSLENYFSEHNNLAGIVFHNVDDGAVPEKLVVSLRFPGLLRTVEVSNSLDDRLWMTRCSGIISPDGTGAYGDVDLYLREGFLQLQHSLYMQWIRLLKNSDTTNISRGRNKEKETVKQLESMSADENFKGNAESNSNEETDNASIAKDNGEEMEEKFAEVGKLNTFAFKEDALEENDDLRYFHPNDDDNPKEDPLVTDARLSDLFLAREQDLRQIQNEEIPLIPHIQIYAREREEDVLAHHWIYGYTYGQLWVAHFLVSFVHFLMVDMLIILFCNNFFPLGMRIMKNFDLEENPNYDILYLILLTQSLTIVILMILLVTLNHFRPGFYIGQTNFLYSLLCRRKPIKANPPTGIITLDRPNAAWHNFEFGPFRGEEMVFVKNVVTTIRRGGANHQILKNVTMRFFKGEITVILGAEENGRVSLLCLMAGWQKPELGDIYYKGNKSIYQHWSDYRSRIDIYMQQSSIFDSLSVKSTLRYFGTIKQSKYNREELEREVNKWLLVLSGKIRPNDSVKNLSYGEKRLLVLCCTLFGNTSIVLLHEPTQFLKYEDQQMFWQILQEEKDERAIIVTTTSIDEAEWFADRIGILDDGVLLAYGSPFFLKTRFGIGCDLIILKDPNRSSGPITEIINKFVPNAVPDNQVGDLLLYKLPTDKRSIYQRMLLQLEDASENLGITSIRVSSSELSEVFMTLGMDSTLKPTVPEITTANTRYVIQKDDTPDTEYSTSHYDVRAISFNFAYQSLVFTCQDPDNYGKRNLFPDNPNRLTAIINQPLRISYYEQTNLLDNQIFHLHLAIIMGIIMPITMSCFLIFLVEERRNYLLTLQLIAGIELHIYWMVGMAWDIERVKMALGHAGLGTVCYPLDDDDVVKERMRIAKMPRFECKRYRVLADQIEKKIPNHGKRLNTVSFALDKYMSMGIYGCHKAGKTHLIEQLAGARGFRFGEMYIEKIDFKYENKAAIKLIGFCPQNSDFGMVFSPRQLFTLLFMIRGVPEANVSEKLLEIATSLDLKPYMNRKIGDLPLAVRRKVSVAISLITYNKVLVLDEPTKGMPAKDRRIIWNVLRYARFCGETVIFSSNENLECETLADLIIVIDDGELLAVGSPQYLRQKYTRGFFFELKILSDGKTEEETSEKQHSANLLKFYIPVEEVTYSYLFGSIEKNRRRLNIAEYTINQAPLLTALDNVLATRALREPYRKPKSHRPNAYTHRLSRQRMAY
uniref:ABC transporter domain-containing protein n=1 Tax=Glossina austeni TaxID=7395 RepID=A0A1A9UE59_GLOAU